MESPVTVKLHESLKNVEDRTCLVLDDDGPFLQRLARALTQRGFLVSATSKVSEARDIARLNPPAFAVLDLRLEDGSGLDVVEESGVTVDHIMDLGFGKCKLCVQAPVAHKITNVEDLAGKRIVTSFPDLTTKFFSKIDAKKGTKTSVKFVSGSVEAACGLGLADAVSSNLLIYGKMNLGRKQLTSN